MTIDDELLLELFKPDPYDGNLGKDALIVRDRIVTTRTFDYKLEEPFQPTYRRFSGEVEREYPKAIPDITIIFRKMSKTIAIELENDIKWDFQASLRQLKKYKEVYSETRIIIPREYKRFAPLYIHEGFPVYLWNAKRKWECRRCHHININESRIPPKCEGKDEKGQSCKNISRDEFDLVGLEDTQFKEYVPDST